MEGNRHTHEDLRQMQSLPLDAKIIMTQRRIRDWYDYWNGDVYVSFSGGKDSTVLKHIADGLGYDIPAVFVNTGLEYPEIQTFVREVKAGKYDCFNKNVEILRPEMRFDEVIQIYGFPVVSKEVSQTIHDIKRQSSINGINPRETKLYNRKFNPESEYLQKYPSYCLKRWEKLLDAPFMVSHRCCTVMKKKPSYKYEKESGRKPIIGTMAAESALRRTKWLKDGCNAFAAKRPVSTPLAFWTEQDILHYIKRFNVPYSTVYGEIQVKQDHEAELAGQINLIDYLGDYDEEDTLETTGCYRTGCMFCMFGCHLDKAPNRFQRMRETHPKQYDYCMNQLGLKEVLDYINVPYE